MALTIDAGSPLLVEIEFTRAEPFKGYTLFDPSVATYVIIAPDNTEKVSGSLTTHDVGRWYCMIQTETNWDAGDYVVRISSTYNSASDIEVKETAFTLSTAHVS